MQSVSQAPDVLLDLLDLLAELEREKSNQAEVLVSDGRYGDRSHFKVSYTSSPPFLYWYNYMRGEFSRGSVEKTGAEVFSADA